MEANVKVSVIIPTYNRVEALHRLLISLSSQTISPEDFEVIVVDDGSEYEPAVVTGRNYPYSLKFIRQKNQGATVARNRGAQQSRGEVLVFIDDDVTISEKTLEALAETCTCGCRVAAVGSLFLRPLDPASRISQAIIAEEEDRNYRRGKSDGYLPYVWCNTQLLGVRRNDFFELGMLQDPSGGWPNWDDVDFGYRAHHAGLRLRECPEAVGEHWDHSIASVRKACQRWFRASKSAVRLFHKYPSLQEEILMYSDKSPIGWRHDSLRMILRKSLRGVLSSRLALFLLENITTALGRVFPSKALLQRLYRWSKGGYMYRGYQAGLKEYGPAPAPEMDR